MSHPRFSEHDERHPVGATGRTQFRLVAPADAADAARSLDAGQRQLVRKLCAAVAARLVSEVAYAEDAFHDLTPSTRSRLVANFLADELERLEATHHQPGAQNADSDQQTGAIAAAAQRWLLDYGGLEPCLTAPDLETVHIVGSDPPAAIRRDGTTTTLEPVVDSDADLVTLVNHLANRTGSVAPYRWGPHDPRLAIRLPDGSRLTGLIGRTARPTVTIRRHHYPDADLADLVTIAMMDDDTADLLRAAVRARRSIVVSGPAAAGKTTLLGALVREIEPRGWVVLIEDTPELTPDDEMLHWTMALHPHPLFEEDPHPVARLLHYTQKLNPDRVIVADIKDDYTADLLFGGLTLPSGTMGTVAADDPGSALRTLATFVRRGRPGRTPHASAALIADHVDLVVHLGAATDGRRVVTSIVEVDDSVELFLPMREIMRPGPDGRAVVGEAPSRRLAAALDVDPSGLRHRCTRDHRRDRAVT